MNSKLLTAFLFFPRFLSGPGGLAMCSWTIIFPVLFSPFLRWSQNDSGTSCGMEVVSPVGDRLCNIDSRLR